MPKDNKVRQLGQKFRYENDDKSGKFLCLETVWKSPGGYYLSITSRINGHTERTTVPLSGEKEAKKIARILGGKEG